MKKKIFLEIISFISFIFVFGSSFSAEAHSETLSTLNNVKTINPLPTDPNPDPRTFVQCPECDPEFSPIGTVDIRYHDGFTARGTGFLIANNIIATAAHLVHSTDHPGVPQQLVFTPSSGANLDAPFGSANGIGIVVPQEYVSTESPLYDYAAIELDNPLGVDAAANHFGLRAPDESVLSTSAIRVAGYPAQAHGLNTQNMWSATSSASLLTGRRILMYNPITSPGQSGSPIVLASDPRYAIGISIRSATGTGTKDYGVFFDTEVLNFFSKVFAQQ